MSAISALAEPPVDWRGIAYVLAGVIACLASSMSVAILKLYKDLKACRKEQLEQALEQERFLKKLLEDLT